jgi:hypothetical protein
MNDLAWLSDWYLSQCDGDWEHQNGVEIRTIDNPGWSLKIDLSETSLKDVPFIPIAVGDMESNDDPLVRWYICRVREGRFEAFGGPLDLELILRIFRDWVEGCTGTSKTS